jgi:serine/threonine protein kinase
MRPETVGPYRILEPLREGSVSSVYRATAPDGATVALKVFSLHLLIADQPAAARAAGPPAAIPSGASAAAAEVTAPPVIARFRREIEAAMPLRHPNILQVLGTGQDGDQLYLATELFDGISLERLLDQGRLPIPQAIAVMRGLCRGLAHAHGRGLVHGHLSPRHLLIAPGVAAVKVADFGPSEIDVVSELDSTLRTGAYALGSFHYLAPEQVGRRGAAPDPRSDLYAAGVIFFEMLTGQPPGGRFSLPSQANAELPPAVDVVVLRCLARNPDDRYPSAAALLSALDELEEALRVRLLSHLRGISRLLGPSGSRRRALLLAAAVLLLFAALALARYGLSR